MVLLVSNEDVRSLLNMEDCVSAIEDGYSELAAGRAIYNNRRDTFMPTSDPETFFRFKTFNAGIMKLGVFAQRVLPDLMEFPVVDGQSRVLRKGKEIPELPGQKRYWGLILLYGTESYRLLAIIHDGYLNPMRVAGTSGVGARYLARANSVNLGLLGSGWQAEPHLWAMHTVRTLKQVKVYSPNRAHADGFASRTASRFGLDVQAVASAQEAVENADIICAATNALDPVCRGEWVKDGMHLTSIINTEFDEDAFRKADLIISSNRGHIEENAVDSNGRYFTANDYNEDYRPVKLFYGKHVGESRDSVYSGYENKTYQLTDLLSGKGPRRSSDRQITMFLKSMGLGIEYAAVGKKVYDLAKERGVGRELPDEWFSQTIR